MNSNEKTNYFNLSLATELKAKSSSSKKELAAKLKIDIKTKYQLSFLSEDSLYPNRECDWMN